MSISKITTTVFKGLVFGAKKSASKTADVVKTVADKTVAAKASETIAQKTFESTDDFLKRIVDSTKIDLSRYSQGTLDSVDKLRQALHKITKPETFKIYDDYIAYILKYHKNEAHVKLLFSSPNMLYKYTESRSLVLKEFKNAYSKSVDDKINFIEELTLYKLLLQKDYGKLVNSYTLKQIKTGNVDLKCIEKAKRNDIIKDDFLYKFFEDLENSAIKRAKESGINAEKVKQLLKVHDEKITKDITYADELLTMLEKPKNPKLVNKILSKLEINEDYKKDYVMNMLKEVLESAETKPEIVSKVLKIKKNQRLFFMNRYIKMFEHGNSKIDDKIFNYYLNIEKSHPDFCSSSTLASFEKILQATNGDEKFAKLLLEKMSKDKNASVWFTEIAESISDNSCIPSLKAFLKKEKLNSEDFSKMYISTFSKSVTDNEELYKDVFSPIYKAILNTNPLAEEKAIYIAERITKMKVAEPQKFEQLEKSGILKLIYEGKINPRILFSYSLENSQLLPEVIEDAQKLLKGESLIKKFTTTKDVLKKTTTGDVISVNGKMYINNNGKLEPWSLTEEKFNELFPLVDRFSTSQAIDDCYLITVTNRLYQNPKTRGSYYKLFEQVGDDIHVTIPAYKDYNGTVIFKKGEIVFDSINGYSADAAQHVQMLEQAYQKTALRDNSKALIHKNPLDSNDLNFLNLRISGGNQEDVLKEFSPILPNKKPMLQRYYLDTEKQKAQAENIISMYANNPRYMITVGHGFGKGTRGGHARTVIGYDKESKTVAIADPTLAGIQENCSLDKFFENILQMTVRRFG